MIGIISREKRAGLSAPRRAVFGSLIDAHESLAQEGFPDVETLHRVNVRDDASIEAYFGVAKDNPVAGKLSESMLASDIQVPGVGAIIAIFSFRRINSAQAHGLFLEHTGADFDFGLECITVDNFTNSYFCLTPGREVYVCFRRTAANFLVGWNVCIYFRRVVGDNLIAFKINTGEDSVDDADGCKNQQTDREKGHTPHQTLERSR